MKAKPGMLDISVLIALIDPAHQFHDAAHFWFKSHRRSGWATCPMTENGCIRIMSHPGYPFPGLSVDRVRSILTGLTRVEGHLFWPDSVSLLETKWARLAGVGPRQITDVYLLGLAVKNGGRFVTFDHAIPVQTVAGFEPGCLEIL